jgi:hypothetical protein
MVRTGKISGPKNYLWNLQDTTLGIGVTLLAIGTSAVNIWLTIHNTRTEERINTIKQDIEKARLRIQQDAAELEKSKEKTSRYIFVKPLLNDALGEARSDKKMLTINLIRLALTDQEVKKTIYRTCVFKQQGIAGYWGRRAWRY